ncbi:MAG: hypothetical protein HN879_10195 [Flavobacteriaceae bacterium]|jgi:hypothetical protein|nr:hypothetical protein [Flavobacteriaceae bacterium]
MKQKNKDVTYPIKDGKTDLGEILKLIDNGDLRDIEDKIISCKCANCGEFAINTVMENEENKDMTKRRNGNE